MIQFLLREFSRIARFSPGLWNCHLLFIDSCNTIQSSQYEVRDRRKQIARKLKNIVTYFSVFEITHVRKNFSSIRKVTAASNRKTETLASDIFFLFVVYSHFKHSVSKESREVLRNLKRIHHRICIVFTKVKP